MHELAICQGLLTQVEEIAAQKGANGVHVIRLRIGPLSGVEPPLLRQAFSVARSGTIAAGAKLEIDFTDVTVRCRECGIETGTRPNRLLCGQCGGWQVDVTEGDELILMSVELSVAPDGAGPRIRSNNTEKSAHV